MDFTSAVVAGIPLILVVIGLVSYVKKLGLVGKALTGASLGIGLVLGIGYQVSLKPPVEFGEWFAVVIYGLGLGLVASGIYDAATSIVVKAINPTVLTSSLVQAIQLTTAPVAFPDSQEATVVPVLPLADASHSLDNPVIPLDKGV